MTDINDKEMASFEVIHTQNNSSGSFESNEYSFLPEVSACALQNGGYDHMPDNFDMTNMQSALSTTTPDLSVEDVESRLIKIVEENQSLKEALSHNNAMMKEQMSTIPAWREQMIRSRNQLQQSLQKSSEKVTSLEKENADLLEKLRNLEKKFEDLDDQLLKCQNLESALNDMEKEKEILEKNKSIMANELKDMNNLHEQLQQSLISACCYLDKLLLKKSNLTEDEREQLRSFAVLLRSKIAALEGNFCATVQTDEETGYEVVHQKVYEAEACEENMQQLTKATNEIEELKKQLEEKNKELDLLKQNEEKMAEKILAFEKRQQESEIAIKNRYEVMSNKLDIESSLTGKYKERCESLQQQLEECHAKLENVKLSDDHAVIQLREEIKNLQDILKLEQRASQKDKEKLDDIMVKCEQLQVDYDRVTKLLEIQSKDEKKMLEEQSILHQTEEKRLLEEVDHLTAQLFDNEQKLEQKTEEVTKLTEKLSMVEEESENIPILKSQVEVYKRDMELVIAEKETASQEIERLQKELKKYQDSAASLPTSTHRSRGRRGQDLPKDSEPIVCPLCAKGFDTVPAAQNHINRCLEDSSAQ